MGDRSGRAQSRQASGSHYHADAHRHRYRRSAAYSRADSRPNYSPDVTTNHRTYDGADHRTHCVADYRAYDDVDHRAYAVADIDANACTHGGFHHDLDACSDPDGWCGESARARKYLHREGNDLHFGPDQLIQRELDKFLLRRKLDRLQSAYDHLVGFDLDA